MTILTKENRTKNNKLIGQANRLGRKIEFWSFIEEFANEIASHSAAKIFEFQNEQDKVLDEINEIRKGSVELIEMVKETN